MTRTILDSGLIRNAVMLACRAPSLHNSQPWRWVAEGPVLHLFADRDRIGQAVDSSGREVILSCGAVLDHLRVAMAASGWDTATDRYPNPNNPDHLATLDFSRMEFVTEAHRRRADAILRRRTDRLPFAPPSDWDSFELLLRDTFDESDATLDVIPDAARPELAKASALTEELRRYDSSYQAELQWWTSPFEIDRGVPPTSLLSESEAARVDVARAFPTVGHTERRAAYGSDRSKIVALSTADDTHDEVLRCGEVLSTVLLECTMAELATCTLTHMTEMAASRDIIRELTGCDGLPQLLIRIGRTPAVEDLPPATPRRPVTDVLHFRA
jgi:hypothetical protein